MHKEGDEENECMYKRGEEREKEEERRVPEQPFRRHLVNAAWHRLLVKRVVLVSNCILII